MYGRTMFARTGRDGFFAALRMTQQGRGVLHSAFCVFILNCENRLIFHDHLLIIQLGKQLDKLEFY